MNPDQPTPAVRAAEIIVDNYAHPGDEESWMTYRPRAIAEVAAIIAAHVPAEARQASNEAHGWRPISEAPRELVIIVTDGAHIAFSELCPKDGGGEYWAEDGDGGLDWAPTLWLPAPPQAIAGDGEGGVNPALDRDPSNPNRLAR